VADQVVPVLWGKPVVSVRRNKNQRNISFANKINVLTHSLDAINTCGATVTLNNTYWQSPSVAVNAPTICALNIKLDNKFVEQLGKPICQIR
jgi:hypothetical protein